MPGLSRMETVRVTLSPGRACAEDTETSPGDAAMTPWHSTSASTAAASALRALFLMRSSPFSPAGGILRHFPTVSHIIAVFTNKVNAKPGELSKLSAAAPRQIFPYSL